MLIRRIIYALFSQPVVRFCKQSMETPTQGSIPGPRWEIVSRPLSCPPLKNFVGTHVCSIYTIKLCIYRLNSIGDLKHLKVKNIDLDDLE